MSAPMHIKADDRPAKGSWAPGNYLCGCVSCSAFFTGDKRAIMCADCAYSKPKDATHGQ